MLYDWDGAMEGRSRQPFCICYTGNVTTKSVGKFNVSQKISDFDGEKMMMCLTQQKKQKGDADKSKR